MFWKKERRIPVDVFLFSCLSSFHFKWTWTHSNEVKKICDGCLRVWLSVSCLTVHLFLLVCAVVPASDLHPLIHKLPLPKSCLSSWEISPTSCASVFFHPLTLHLLPRPPRLSLTHSYPGLISFFFFFSLSLSHTIGISGVSHSSRSSAFCVVWSPFLMSVSVDTTHRPLPRLLL